MKRLGERIRKKRELFHLQLNELAAKVGITSSALSQIESGKAFPSIFNLKTIAESLQTTVGELIGENDALVKNPLVKYSEIKFIRANNSGAELFLLSHHDQLKLIETYLIRLKPGSDTEEIFREHGGQEFIHILSGEVSFELGDRTLSMEKGDSLYYNSSGFHFAKNNSKNASEIIWIVTPANI